MSDLVVHSKVKQEVKKHNKSLSADYSVVLSEKVRTLIEESVRRASDNGRSTVMAKDL
jgi:histone H3/H4